MFAWLTRAADVMASMTYGGVFLVGKNLVVLFTGSFSLWLLLSELSWVFVGDTSVSGLLAWNFIHGLCCRISVFHGGPLGQPSGPGL